MKLSVPYPVVVTIAIAGFKRLAAFATVCSPWMLLMFVAGALVMLPPLAEDICRCFYGARLKAQSLPEVTGWDEFVNQCKRRRLAEGAIVSWFDRKERKHTAKVAEAVHSVAVENADESERGLTFELELRGENACRPDRFLAYFLELKNGSSPGARIEKRRSYVKRGGFLKDPMEF